MYSPNEDKTVLTPPPPPPPPPPTNFSKIETVLTKRTRNCIHQTNSKLYSPSELETILTKRTRNCIYQTNSKLYSPNELETVFIRSLICSFGEQVSFKKGKKVNNYMIKELIIHSGSGIPQSQQLFVESHLEDHNLKLSCPSFIFLFIFYFKVF